MYRVLILFFPILLFSSSDLEELFSLSLEELMEVKVTTVSKKETDAFKSSSSLYIITQEQIRRSGLRTIPELLRLAPGLHVGRISGNQWAVNSRAPNQAISREMRIMIDGRDLYNTFFNGVYWDSINVMVEDIERIEVVRGPGASLWGTNTAHGVINIITKKASLTQGGLVSGSYGSAQDEYTASARYGFSLGDSDVRVYATRRQFDRSEVPSDEEYNSLASRPSGSQAYDGHHLSQGGFVSDIDINLENRMRLSADVYQGESEEESSSSRDLSKIHGGNLYLRYEAELDLHSQIGFNAYVDYFSRQEPTHKNKMRVIDVNFQHIYTRSNHSIVWGGEYKNSLNEFLHDGGSFTLAIDPQRKIDEVYSLFIQDDISFFNEKVVLTPSIKYGNNDYTNDTYQPSLRLGYYPDERHTLWASATRSEAEPSRLAVGGYLDLNDFPPFLCAPFGGIDDSKLGCIIPFLKEDVTSNVINTYELGYRQIVSDRLIVDNTLFYDDYKQKGTDGTNADKIYGYELNTKYAALKEWKLEFSYAFHYGKESYSTQASTPIKTLPKHSISASSFYTFKEDTDLDIMYYFLDNTDTTDSYSRVDIRLEHRPMPNLRLSVVGENLLDNEHVEFNADSTRGNSVVQRAVIAKISYEF